jgi:hypothetical protein
MISLKAEIPWKESEIFVCADSCMVIIRSSGNQEVNTRIAGYQDC